MKTTTAPEPNRAPVDPKPPTNYLDLYGLSKPPFGKPADKNAYILFGSQRRAFELLTEHAINASGMILLYGEEGVGKTETLHSVAAVAAESDIPTILIPRPPNGRTSLMQVLSALGGPNADESTMDIAVARFLLPPRKVLLVDDIDLMPPDCIRLLFSVVQRLPNEPGASAIVLTCSTDMTADVKRPELSRLANLASNTIRLTPLNSAEIRQYIERSLWIAGGATRRLIGSDAIKLIINQSGGFPGVTNRLMEAVLTAGFARGDSMITAKTVAAAMGPTAPRPPHRSAEHSGVTQHAVQLVALGLLVVGVSAFLYRGLTGQVDHAITASSSPPAPQTPPLVAPKPPEQPPLTKPVETLPPELVAALMKRGDQSLGLGDIAAARLLYQRAAEAGNAPAATALGKTYDPNFTTPGNKPDPAYAVEWYQRALALGDQRAADLLKRLH